MGMYKMEHFEVPEGYTYQSYTKEAVKNIRQGNKSEEYKNNLYALTFPSILNELKKYKNYDTVEELVPLTGIAFMKTLNKYDPDIPNASFMNYYKRAVCTDIITSYTKHRTCSKEFREKANMFDRTMVYLDEIVMDNNDHITKMDLTEDKTFTIDDELLKDDLVRVIYKLLDNMYGSDEKEQIKEKIFRAYIDSCINDTILRRDELAAELGVSASHVTKTISKGKERLKVLLKREGYVWWY